MKTEHIIVRSHPDIKKECEQAAKRSKMTLSEWMRMIIRERLEVAKARKSA